MKPAAGALDRRITVEVASSVQDGAGDPVLTWAPAFRLFARRHLKTSPEAAAGNEFLGDQSVIRRTELVWEVRWGPLALSIAPETHRVVYKGRIYQVLAINEGAGRQDRVWIRCAATTDQRGSMAPAGET